MNLALDDAITEYERKRLNDHLASCPECRLVNEALKSISEAISEDMVEPPECLVKNVMSEIKTHRHFGWKSITAAAACFVLIASAVGVGFFQNRDASADPGSASAYTQTSDVDGSGTYDPDALAADADGVGVGNGLRPSRAESDESQQGRGDDGTRTTSDATEEENSGENAPAASKPAPDGESQNGQSDAQQEPADGSVSLMDVPTDVFDGMVSAEIYFSGSVSSSEPDVTLTGAEEIEMLSEILTYEQAAGIPVPEGEALFTVIAVNESGERTEIRVWRSNLQLLMEFNGELYTVSGLLEDILALIE